MTRSDTLHLQIFASVASQLEHLGSQIFQDGSRIDSGSGTNTTMRGGAVLEMAMDTTNGELENELVSF